MIRIVTSHFGRLGAILGVVALAGTAVLANAPDRSIRPEARPGLSVQASVPVRFDASIRPRPRTAWSASNLRVLLDGAETPATQTPIVPASAGVSTQALPPATTPSSAAPIVRFSSQARPRARPWLDRTRPSGPAQSPLVIPANATEQAPEAETALASTAPVFSSPRPPARPANLQRRAVAAAVAPRQSTPRASGSGTICGDPAIQGRVIPAIAGTLTGCGVANPVQVTSIHGITMSTPATMDCGTAQALSTWVRDGAIPAVGNMGGGIAQFRVAAHYACRTRNSQPGARISEHGKGRAIDISAFRLRNGDTMNLLQGWNDSRQGRVLRQMWQAACGPFGTVLGPEANRFHLDHFHFDTARYRSGSYCR